MASASRYATAMFGVAALVVMGVASCGSFSGDGAGSGESDAADAIAAETATSDAPSSTDASSARDVSNDAAEAGLDTGAARHLKVFALTALWSIVTTYDDGGVMLAGRDSADQLCADEGAAAGLGHAFYAFMSRPGADALARLPADANWSLPNAAGPTDLVFASRSAIDLGEYPRHALNRGAGGAPLTDATTGVWTGTTVNGRASGDDCSDWGVFSSGTTGRTDSVGPAWVNAGSSSCGAPLHVFCFGY